MKASEPISLIVAGNVIDSIGQDKKAASPIISRQSGSLTSFNGVARKTSFSISVSPLGRFIEVKPQFQNARQPIFVTLLGMLIPP